MSNINQLRELIRDAMTELENLPCGAIGSDGPTLDELDSHADATGHCWEDDAVYHCGQRTWRILETALNNIK